MQLANMGFSNFATLAKAEIHRQVRIEVEDIQIGKISAPMKDIINSQLRMGTASATKSIMTVMSHDDFKIGAFFLNNSIHLAPSMGEGVRMKGDYIEPFFRVILYRLQVRR